MSSREIAKVLRNTILWTVTELASIDPDETPSVWVVTMPWDGKAYEVPVALPLTLAVGIELHTDWTIRAA